MKFCLSKAGVGISLLVLAGFEGVSVVAQTITSYGTSSGGFSIQCDPVPGRCAFDLPSDGDADYSERRFSVDVTAQFPFLEFSERGQFFRATGCTNDEGCSISCDDECSCITGELNDDVPFAPDGGNCTILTQTPGVLPTLEPSSSPSYAPSVNLETTVLFEAPPSFDELTESQQIRFNCDSSAQTFDLCKLVSGTATGTVSDSEGNHGWRGPCTDCIIRCSEACTCDIATIENGPDEKIGECAVVNPSESPSSAPSPEPTTASSTASKLFMGVQHLLFLLVGSTGVILQW
mmetsp:Transcript_43690/g.64868  ORF Transcript_43690/g.64868 Transcript_43690/m.64868 type:complete len:291 (-) Transcript_43690:118-990(-)|eukprot:CAMPEP_0194048242 /NCGR_PEP_ID=MMETSP0009_2-20130614/26806_1 /TAXON_ID=210454 /ORGANISM="Grammatophora oceanica, Strain CCMP 410" /LENGTH=290 /DNA_ID=CAMNT_0038694063 /DNA_START=102 /DNA_END=974 /DNA_ORIENTATION=+